MANAQAQLGVRQAWMAMDPMDFREKALYHQIHPAKLLTDWGTAFLAAYLFWLHDLRLAFLVGTAPAVITSALIIGLVDLTPHRASAFGRYLARFITPATQVTRVLGLILFWAGAWFHVLWAMALGLCVGR